MYIRKNPLPPPRRPGALAQRLIWLALAAVVVCIVVLRIDHQRAAQEATQPTPAAAGYISDEGWGEDAYTGTESEAEEESLTLYRGSPEHIFFRPLIAYPELAFDGDSMESTLDNNLLTVSEYTAILESLYANGYILVDIDDLYQEGTGDQGQVIMEKKDLYLPEGKTPLLISFEDMSYYESYRNNGTVYKLIVTDEGELASWGRDPEGNEVVSRELDCITILEDFIAAHPDFSYNGARGIIGFTGYAGILGYSTQSGAENREEEIEAVQPVINKLISLGWTFASQGYNYIDYSLADSETIRADTEQWLEEVGSLVGPVKVLLYPYGGRVAETENTDFLYLQGMGFRIFCSVGVETYVNIRSGMAAVCMDRLHPDGSTLRWQRSLYLHLFDAAAVLDIAVRPDYGYDFG